MSIIIPANSAVGGGFEVANSIMLQDSRLFKTPSSSGSQRKFTFSAWVKKSDFSSGVIFSSGEADGNPNFALYFASNDKLNLYSSQGMEYTTNAIFRDSNAWMHIVISVNTASSNASNRQLIWINGVQQTSFGTSNSIAQNTDLSINTSAYRMAVGTGVDNQDYFGGYVAEVVFLDNQALGHLSFGEFDSDSGIWKPIAITGSAATPGTNGFYLNFQDSSNLGNDEFGGTDLSVSDIVATDQKTDTCTNNFCTFNLLDNINASTFAEGSLKITTVSGNYSPNTSTFRVIEGKWYWEIKLAQDTGSGSNEVDMIGFSNNSVQATSTNPSSIGINYRGNGKIWNYGGSAEATGYATFSTGDIIMVAADLTNATTGKLYFGVNGTWGNSGNPETGANSYDFTKGTEEWGPSVTCYSSGSSVIFEGNFGNPSFSISSGNADGNGYGNFEYAPPSGYLSLNSKNLSEVLS